MANSLLDKASIITTPTAYSDGSLHSVKPVKTFGSELVTNGTFDTDSNWTKGTGWSISGGKAIKTSGTGSALSQTVPTTTVGKKYKLTFDAIVTSGVANAGLYGVTIPNFTTTGSQEHIITATSTSGFEFFAASNFNGSIDNVSVKEVIDADFDFTRGSSATRVNEKGLIEDVQILSGELVQNGDFSEEGSELITNGGFDTNSNWTLASGITYNSNGYIDFDGTQGMGQARNTPNTTFVQGRIYKVVFEIKNYVSGTVKFRLQNGINTIGQSQSGNGVKTEYVTCNDSSNNNFQFFNSATFIGSIDNVSVKEVGQNWTVTNGNISDKYNASMTAYQSGIKITPFVKTGTYKVVFDLVVTSGSCKFDAGGGNDEIYTTSGTKEILITNPTKFEFNAFNLGWVGSLDNVSVIQITEDTNLPRIDYKSGTGSLLLEPQSTNLFNYSSDFTEWQLVNISTELSNTLSPDGSSFMTKATFSSAGTNSYVRRNRNMNSGSITVSIFVKKGLVDSFASLRIVNLDNPVFVWFNLDNGTIASETGSPTNKSIVDYGNGIYRISVTTTSTSDLSFSTMIQSASADGGVPTENATQFYWGGMAENQSFATSYIPTEDSTVTRLADVCNNAGSSDLISSTSGVLYAQIAALANDGTSRQISLSDGSNANNKISLRYTPTTNRLNAFVKSGGSVVFDESETLSDITQNNKLALKYKQNDFSLYVNGIELATDTSGNTPTGLNVLDFDSAIGTLNFYGNVKCVAVFKEALSNDELECLTGEGFSSFNALAQANNYTII